MAPKQQTLGYVKPSQTTLKCVENISPLFPAWFIDWSGSFFGDWLLMGGNL